MGELNRDLSKLHVTDQGALFNLRSDLSSIRYLEQHEISFSPNTSPVRSFKTPMQQIVASKYIPNHTEQSKLTVLLLHASSLYMFLADSYLAVRTFDATSVMKVATSDTSKMSAQIAELASIVPTDTDRRAIVDIKLFSSPFATFAITDNGALYRLNVADGRKAM